MTLSQLVSDAINEKVRKCPMRKGKPWMKSFGALKHLDNVQIHKIIDRSRSS